MKKHRKAIIKIVVSVSLIVFLLSKVGIANLIANLRMVDLRYAPLIVGLIIVHYVIGGFRWKKFLIYDNCEHVSVRYLINLYFIGSFFNNFMPTSVGGDAVKFYKLGRRIGSKTNAFTATFMERFTGVVALVLVSYYGLIKTLDFWVNLLPASISVQPVLVTLFKLFLFLGFWIGMVAAFLVLKFASKKIGFLNKIYSSLMVYRGRKDILIYALVTSFLIQLLAIFTQYFSFIALGITVPLDYAFFVLPVITLAGFFIPSLNGLGVQDALYIQFFGIIGIAPELALSASIVYHLFRLVVSLIGGVLYALGKAD